MPRKKKPTAVAKFSKGAQGENDELRAMPAASLAADSSMSWGQTRPGTTAAPTGAGMAIPQGVQDFATRFAEGWNSYGQVPGYKSQPERAAAMPPTQAAVQPSAEFTERMRGPGNQGVQGKIGQGQSGTYSGSYAGEPALPAQSVNPTSTGQPLFSVNQDKTSIASQPVLTGNTSAGVNPSFGEFVAKPFVAAGTAINNVRQSMQDQANGTTPQTPYTRAVRDDTSQKLAMAAPPTAKPTSAVPTLENLQAKGAKFASNGEKVPGTDINVTYNQPSQQQGAIPQFGPTGRTSGGWQEMRMPSNDMAYSGRTQWVNPNAPQQMQMPQMPSLAETMERAKAMLMDTPAAPALRQALGNTLATAIGGAYGLSREQMQGLFGSQQQGMRNQGQLQNTALAGRNMQENTFLSNALQGENQMMLERFKQGNPTNQAAIEASQAASRLHNTQADVAQQGIQYKDLTTAQTGYNQMLEQYHKLLNAGVRPDSPILAALESQLGSVGRQMKVFSDPRYINASPADRQQILQAAGVYGKADGGVIEPEMFAGGGAIPPGMMPDMNQFNAQPAMQPQHQMANAEYMNYAAEMSRMGVNPIPMQQYLAIKAMNQRAQPAFAQGGRVPQQPPMPVAGQELQGVGPAAGGPKEDTIPAVIDGSRPAALSSGEFVYTDAATEAVGSQAHQYVMKALERGDPAVVSGFMALASKAATQKQPQQGA